jgi:hypothetical protein
MENVIRAIGRIQLIPGAHVDRNFGQGRDAVVKQHQIRLEKEQVSFIDEFITESQQAIGELHAWVAPYHLPEDYVFFLEFYGGLQIKTDDYSFFIDGIGPMVEEWYGFIMGDDAYYENGFLAIADLPLLAEERIDQRVTFFLDLAGIIHQGCVIGIPSWKLGELGFPPILQDPHAHAECWVKHADSFTEWLDQVAATGGGLGYA